MTIETIHLAKLQHRLIHDIYVLLDDGDRQVLDLLNLTPIEFAVLQQLDVEQGRRLTDVGTALLCVKSTITRVIDRLERDQLVKRMPDPDDRRAQRVVLSLKGVQVRYEAVQLHAASVERRMALLSNDEQQQLGELLHKLCSGLQSELHRSG